jgi:hypothetical protein
LDGVVVGENYVHNIIIPTLGIAYFCKQFINSSNLLKLNEMVVQHLQGRVLEDNAPRSEHEEEVEAKRPAADAAAFGDRDGDGGADELVSHTGKILTRVWNTLFLTPMFKDAEDDLVKNCNYLLAQVGLNVKNVESYKELTRVRTPVLFFKAYVALCLILNPLRRLPVCWWLFMRHFSRRDLWGS